MRSLGVFIIPPAHPSLSRAPRSDFLGARPVFARESVRPLIDTCRYRFRRSLQTAPFVATASGTWRNPSWLTPRLAPGTAPPPSPRSSWLALAILGALALSNALGKVHKREALLKLLASGTLLSSVAFIGLGYRRVETLAGHLVSDASQATLERSIQLGRLRRVSPLGTFYFAETALGPAPPALASTAPDVKARAVVVGVRRIIPALRRKKPLVLNFSLIQPLVQLRQVVELDAKGLPVGKWDPGLPDPSGGKGKSGSIDAGPPSVQPPADVLPVAKSETLFKTFTSEMDEGKRVEPVVFGSVVAKNATVLLQPADLGIYGQGPELVEIRNVGAQVSFVPEPRDGGDSPQTKRTDRYVTQLVSGIAKARAKGYPVGGGVVDVQASCDISTLPTIQSGDAVVDLSVKGAGIPARKVAAFLNLPFRADAGRCDGDIDMRFLYKVDCMIPEMHGTTSLHDVSLRFHPDPQTPEFTGISGGMRFDDKTLFMDGPSGDLGSLPMTVVGSIDLVGDYNLVGYVRNVDVNNIINTFDVDKFVPVSGQVKGEARMTGPLEEPFVRGRAVSVGTGTFDRVPVEEGSVEFEWDAIAGVLNFTDISAEVAGGGKVVGKGGMYFDMTKITPFDMHRPSHHPNSPKADASPPPLPVDDMDIDKHAPSRPYDSILFEFSVRSVVGSNVITWYGGPNGHLAAPAIGMIEADAVLAGNAKDANCRVLWRSTSQPPSVSISNSPPAGDSEDLPDADEGGQVYVRRVRGPLSGLRGMGAASGASETAVVPDASTFPGSTGLGGGEFRGVVFMKLGDLPAARRVKIRTTVSDLDARRLGWGGEELRPALANSPLMLFAADSYFKGVVRQRLVPVEEGSGLNPRTPQAELVGGDGVLAVRGLRLNKLRFAENMTGFLRFSTDEFALDLKEREVQAFRSGQKPTTSRAPPNGVPKQQKREPSQQSGQPDSSRASSVPNAGPSSPSKAHRRLVSQDVPETLNEGEVGESEIEKEPIPDQTDSEARTGDELRVNFSKNGTGMFSLRSGPAEVVLSIGRDNFQSKILSMFAREFSVDNLLGGNGSGSNGIPSALFSVDGEVNLSERRGDANVGVRRGRYEGFSVDSVSGNLSWKSDKVVLERAIVRVRRSEYHVHGEYRGVGQAAQAEPSWELKTTIPGANVKEVAAFVASQRRRSIVRGNIARSLDDTGYNVEAEESSRSSLAAHMFAGTRGSGHGNPSLFASRNDSSEPGDASMSWSMPDIPFDRQVAWFRSFVEAEQELSKRAKIVGAASKKKLSNVRPGIADLEGNVQGTIVVRYECRNREQSQASVSLPYPVADKGHSLSSAFLEPLMNTSVEFDIRGDDWKLGSHRLGEVKAVGSLSGNKLELESIHLQGPAGFEGSVSGSVGPDGKVSGHVFVKDLSAKTISRYMRTKFRLSGNLSARVDVAGVIVDPVIDGRASWADAKLNGRSVRNARGDVQCRNGRCSLNVDARFGGRATGSTAKENFDVYSPLTGLKGRAGDKAPGKSTTIPPGGDGSNASEGRSRQSGEPLKVAISVPVRFYVLEYMRRSIPDPMWRDLEALLPGLDSRVDDWISVDVNVRKYGLLILGAVFPDLGWIDGSSDIALQVRGTLADPVIEGKGSVSDGQLWPAAFTQPIESVRGEVVFDQSGAVSVRSVSGRYNGRSISISGSLPLTEKHLKITRETAASAVPKGSRLTRAARRAFTEKRTQAANQLDRFTRGIIVDVSDVFIDVKDQFYGKIGCRVAVKNAVLSPSLTGSVNLSKGVVYLAAPPISPETALANMPSIFSQLRSEFRGRGSPLQTARMSSEREGGHVRESETSEGRNGTMNTAPPSEPVIASGSKVGSSGKMTASVQLDALKLALGKDIQLVYPYLLNFGATGVISLDGSSSAPCPSGTVRFTQGELNMFTSKMQIKSSADNYARFEKVDGFPDPIISLALEDRDFVLQVKEVKASKWAERMTVSDKRGEEVSDEAWLGLVQTRLEELQKGFSGGLGIPSLAAKYLINSYSVKGKLGPTRWRVFPALVSPMDMAPGPSSQREELSDIGVGAEFEYGKVAFSLRGSVRGAREGSLVIHPNDRIRLEFESNGPRSSGEIEVRVSSSRRRSKRIPGSQDSAKGRIVYDKDGIYFEADDVMSRDAENQRIDSSLSDDSPGKQGNAAVAAEGNQNEEKVSAEEGKKVPTTGQAAAESK